MSWRIRWLPTARRDDPGAYGYGPGANESGANESGANESGASELKANESGAEEFDVEATEAGRRWVDVGGLADLRDNRLVADLNGTSVLVVRTGRVLAAIENECPHLGQRLSDGEVSGRVIQCAAHGYRWDLATGRSVQGLRVQRRRPLREVPVRLAGDRIMLSWETAQS
jgi:3-phenylpropionate/trans-cinnamate dioxygenase ferredoxin subunit